MADKQIEQLIPDIYSMLSTDGKIIEDEDKVSRFAHRLVEKMVERLSRDAWKPSLSMSNFGKPCERQLWYAINKPEEAEPLPPQAKIKFLYGDILEEFVIFLADCAGHTVTGHQDKVEVAGVRGRRDVVIDGRLVDVKSANSRAFDKFKYHKLQDEDPFGYLYQLDMYLEGSVADPLVTDKDVASFVAIDKELGHLVLDTYPKLKKDYVVEAARKRAILDNPVPPQRAFHPEPEGKSGNLKLPMPCNYCPHKKSCYPQLRTFLYANGPMHLTHVAREPQVKEIEWPRKL